MDLPTTPNLTFATDQMQFSQRNEIERGMDLMQAAEGFESLFLNQMMKTARQTSLSEGLFDSSATETAQTMFDEAVTDTGAGRANLGLAEAIHRQLAPLAGIRD